MINEINHTIVAINNTIKKSNIPFDISIDITTIKYNIAPLINDFSITFFLDFRIEIIEIYQMRELFH